jgi:hypothetical protein
MIFDEKAPVSHTPIQPSKEIPTPPLIPTNKQHKNPIISNQTG